MDSYILRDERMVKVSVQLSLGKNHNLLILFELRFFVNAKISINTFDWWLSFTTWKWKDIAYMETIKFMKIEMNT